MSGRGRGDLNEHDDDRADAPVPGPGYLGETVPPSKQTRIFPTMASQWPPGWPPTAGRFAARAVSVTPARDVAHDLPEVTHDLPREADFPPGRADRGYPPAGWYPPFAPPFRPAGEQASNAPAARPTGRAGSRGHGSNRGDGAALSWQGGPQAPAARPADWNWRQYEPGHPAARHRGSAAGHAQPWPPEAHPPQPLWVVMLLAGLVAAAVALAVIVIVLSALVVTHGTAPGGQATDVIVPPHAPAMPLAQAR